MFDFTYGKALPDNSPFGVSGKFSRIALQQTAFCHNRCNFCPLHLDKETPKGIMELAELEVVLRALPGFDGLVDLATDGESFMLADLPERCALIKQYWPNCTISLTSTFNIDRGPDFIKNLFSAGLGGLRISCYGHTVADYKKIHGTNSFEALRKNLEYLKEVPDLATKSLLLMDVEDADKNFGTQNAKEKLLEFQKFAATCGIRNTSSTRLHSWQGRVPFGLHENRIPFYPCSVVWGGWANSLNVRWNLAIVPCCYFNGYEFSLGNLRHMSIQEIFNSDTFRDFYTRHWEGKEGDLPICAKCTNYRSLASQEELARFAAWQGSKLAGKKVWFWGAGEAWRRYRSFFSCALPQGILLDTPGTLPKSIAGIPVHHPDAVLTQGEKLPVVIFASPRHSSQILQSITSRYPNYNVEDITLCPADFTFLGENASNATDI